MFLSQHDLGNRTPVDCESLEQLWCVPHRLGMLDDDADGASACSIRDLNPVPAKAWWKYSCSAQARTQGEREGEMCKVSEQPVNTLSTQENTPSSFSTIHTERHHLCLRQTRSTSIVGP